MTDKVTALAQSIAEELQRISERISKDAPDSFATKAEAMAWYEATKGREVKEHAEHIVKILEPRLERAVEWAEDLLKWSEAYPKSLFTEPTPEQVDEVCKTLGFRIDRISAMVLREYTGSWGRKAKAFLASLEVNP